MTCIIAYRLPRLGCVLVAGDSETNFGSDYMATVGPKFATWTVDGSELLIGVSGHGRVLQELQANWEPPKPEWRSYPYQAMTSFAQACSGGPQAKGFLDEDGDLDAGLLMVWQGHIYLIGGNLTVMRPERPFAGVGAGADYAVGALAMAHRVSRPSSLIEARARILEALDIAAHCSHGVSPPYTFRRLAIAGDRLDENRSQLCGSGV